MIRIIHAPCKGHPLFPSAMTRSAAALPRAARWAAEDLVRRAEREVREFESALHTLRLGLDRLRGEDELARIALRGDRDALGRAAAVERMGAQASGTLLAVQTRIEEGLAKLDAEHERAREGREEKRRALQAEERSLESARAAARERARALSDAQASSYGLAPWDAVALRARRAWGEDTDLPTSGTPGEPPMLRGSAAAALVQARLGVSRSTYYERYRPLLRAYHLSPSEVEWLPGGGAVIWRGATQRFSREEVEALLRFLLAAAS